jgi:hypothetical protein
MNLAEISVALVSGFGKKIRTDNSLKARSDISVVWASAYPHRKNSKTFENQTCSAIDAGRLRNSFVFLA